MQPPTVYKAPRPPLLLRSAPRFSEVYWCDFAISNILPEFDDRHPVIIVRSGGKLSNPHIVVPLTSRDHEGDVFAHRLSTNPVTGQRAKDSWAVCNHLYTVASERLAPVMHPKHRHAVYPKVGQEDMRAISVLVRKALQALLFAGLPSQPLQS